MAEKAWHGFILKIFPQKFESIGTKIDQKRIVDNLVMQLFFEKGQSYQLSDHKKCEQLKTKSVVLLEEILPLCPTEIK